MCDSSINREVLGSSVVGRFTILDVLFHKKVKMQAEYKEVSYYEVKFSKHPFYHTYYHTNCMW